MINLILRSISAQTLKGFLTFRKILRYATDGFTSLLKDGMLLIFIAFKNPSPSARIEPAKLESNGKLASHYTTEDDLMNLDVTGRSSRHCDVCSTK
jgi:hypothetical protein